MRIVNEKFPPFGILTKAFIYGACSFLGLILGPLFGIIVWGLVGFVGALLFGFNLPPTISVSAIRICAWIGLIFGIYLAWRFIKNDAKKN